MFLFCFVYKFALYLKSFWIFLRSEEKDEIAVTQFLVILIYFLKNKNLIQNIIFVLILF